MAFVFPEDKADFKAPNGVTYSWDGVKWRTKTYSGAEVDGRLPYRLGTDKAARSARSGEPAVELVDAEDNYSNVKFFGVNGIQIESTISGIRFDGSELLGGDVDLTGYATKDYSDAMDQALSNRLDAVEGVVGQASFTMVSTNAAPRPGQFTMLRKGDSSSSTTRWSEAGQLWFSEQDADGNTYDWSSFVEGDVIRLYVEGDIAMEVSAFEVKVSYANSGIFDITQTAKEIGTGMENATYAVLHLSSFDPSGLATMVYVDAQDQQRLPLTGGTLTGALSGPAFKGLLASGPVITVGTAADEIKAIIHADGHAQFTYPTLDHHAASKRYVDDAVGTHSSALDDYLPLTGGTLTGNLVGELIKSQRASGYAFEVKPGNQLTTGYWNSNGHLSLNPHVADGAYCFSVYTSGLGENKCGFRVTQDGKVKAGHDTSNPFIATSANDVVTKAFFDENAITAKPAQLCWVYAGDKGTTTESPASGYFNLSESSGNLYLRFSFNSDNGVKLGDGKFSDTNAEFEYGPVGTIWEWISSTSKWKLKRQFRIQTWRWNYKPDPAGDAHFEFRMASSNGHGWDTLAEGARYYITVGGFF